MISHGSGAPGGIFAPLLILGALLGLAVGQISHIWFPGIVHDPAAFAVVGMAAYFAAVVRAPLTGIVLIVEMTRCRFKVNTTPPVPSASSRYVFGLPNLSRCPPRRGAGG